MMTHHYTFAFLIIFTSLSTSLAQGLTPDKCVTVDKGQFEQIYPMLDLNGQLILNYEQSPHTVKKFNSDLTSVFARRVRKSKFISDISENGELLAYCEENCTKIVLCDDRGRELFKSIGDLDMATSDKIVYKNFSFSPNANIFAVTYSKTVGEFIQINEFQAEKKSIKELDNELVRSQSRNAYNNITKLEYSPDGRFLFAIGTLKILLFSAEKNKLRKIAEVERVYKDRNILKSIATEDGVYVFYNNEFLLYRYDKKFETSRFSTPFLESVAISPDTKFFVAQDQDESFIYYRFIDSLQFKIRSDFGFGTRELAVNNDLLVYAISDEKICSYSLRVLNSPSQLKAAKYIVRDSSVRPYVLPLITEEPDISYHLEYVNPDKNESQFVLHVKNDSVALYSEKAVGQYRLNSREISKICHINWENQKSDFYLVNVNVSALHTSSANKSTDVNYILSYLLPPNGQLKHQIPILEDPENLKFQEISRTQITVDEAEKLTSIVTSENLPDFNKLMEDSRFVYWKYELAQKIDNYKMSLIGSQVSSKISFDEYFDEVKDSNVKVTIKNESGHRMKIYAIFNKTNKEILMLPSTSDDYKFLSKGLSKKEISFVIESIDIL